MLFDKAPLKELEESIRRVGILVPITVYMATGSDKYTILDGQRRWMCAREIPLETVPVNVVREPTTVENIVTMFQIHKLRKDWELMPTALKVGVLIDELGKQSDRQLAVMTGLDVAVVGRCKKLLTFSKKYQDMMLMANPHDRVRADFFIELYPILTDRVLARAKIARDHLIDRMLFKYQHRKSGMKSITDFRKIKAFVAIAKAAGREDQIVSKFKTFVEDDTYLLDDLEIGVATIHKQATTLMRNAGKLRELIDSLEVEEFLGEEGLWVELEKLASAILKKAASADRRRVA
jgi:ParB/RepB/Spo0J family partition protein